MELLTNFMHACMYVCMYACMQHVCMYVFMYVCIYVCMYVCIDVIKLMIIACDVSTRFAFAFAHYKSVLALAISFGAYGTVLLAVCVRQAI